MWVVADRRYFLLLMGGLIALAWLTLWLWGQSPYGRLLSHDELSEADLEPGLVGQRPQPAHPARDDEPILEPHPAARDLRK